MSIFDIFSKNVFSKQKTSAQMAKDRLRIIVEAGQDYANPEVEKLKSMILDLIAKHANVARNDVQINIDEHDGKSVLELSVNLPASVNDQTDCMTVLDKDLKNSEEIFTFSNERLGYTCFVAFSGSEHGQAIGGCRARSYPSDTEAANDAAALARAMRSKAIAHGLQLDGAKAVLNLPAGSHDRTAILRDFAKHVDSFKGRYITAIDVGTTPKDLDIIAEITPYAVCTSAQLDAALFTAQGVYCSIKAAAEHHLDKSLNALKISIQGLGSVGLHLLTLLRQHTRDILVTDVDPEKIAQARRLFPDLQFCKPDEIYSQQTDIFSPCALGGIINTATVNNLRCKIICGAANNQLASLAMDAFLSERGIVYIPDFFANGGGLIYASSEYLDDGSDSTQEVAKIYTRCLDHIRAASVEGHSLLSHLQRMQMAYVRNHT